MSTVATILNAVTHRMRKAKPPMMAETAMRRARLLEDGGRAVGSFCEFMTGFPLLSLSAVPIVVAMAHVPLL